MWSLSKKKSKLEKNITATHERISEEEYRSGTKLLHPPAAQCWNDWSCHPLSPSSMRRWRLQTRMLSSVSVCAQLFHMLVASSAPFFLILFCQVSKLLPEDSESLISDRRSFQTWTIWRVYFHSTALANRCSLSMTFAVKRRMRWMSAWRLPAELNDNKPANAILSSILKSPCSQEKLNSHGSYIHNSSRYLCSSTT